MMYNSSKSKIRGWKRRLKHIDSWFEDNKEPNFEAFNYYQEDYVKIRIDPWNRLCERNPPVWYSRIILSKLIKIYNHWDEEYKKLETPYDLQLWLNDPNFIRSEVVCAKVDKPSDQRNNYFRKSNKQIDFPLGKWNSRENNLKVFKFELFKDENFSFEKMESLNQEDIAELLAEGYEKDTITIDGKSENRYSQEVGNFWVGRKIN